MSEYVFRIDEPIECCAKCPFIFERLNFDGKDWHYSCFISRKEVPYDGEKAEDCPLVELPTHGRLIDVDFLCKYAVEVYNKETGSVYIPKSQLEHAPTVLEANED